jgi:hypothetical protein
MGRAGERSALGRSIPLSVADRCNLRCVYQNIFSSGQTLAVVAMHPVAQDLPVHPAKHRRFTARAPIHNMRQRLHPPRGIAFMRSHRNVRRR